MERLREKRSCARRLSGAGRGGRGQSAAMDVKEKGAVYVHSSKSGKGEQRRANGRAGRWKWTSSTQEEGEERNEE